MRRFYLTSFFTPQHKFRLRKANAPSGNEYFFYDRKNKNQGDIPKGFIKPDTPVETEKEPDYVGENFRQYSQPEETYRNSREPFFTGKDPLSNFIKPAKIPVDSNSPVNSSVDFEAQNNFREAGGEPDAHSEIMEEMISQKQSYDEFYGKQEGESGQNIPQYQDGTKEIKEALANSFPAFEINDAINEIKQADMAQTNDLSQQETGSQVGEENSSGQFVSGLENNMDNEPAQTEPQPETDMQGVEPLADEVIADSMKPQNLEDMVGQQEMAEEPLPDPFMMQGFLGP